MKITLSLFNTAVLSAGLLSATGAHAALESRLGGLALYDTDFNITWLANADANGVMTWDQANAWASGLTVGGFSGWRLPTTLQPDTSCDFQNRDGSSSGNHCTGSEMGHLFYSELGGVVGSSISSMHNNNYNLFQNLLNANYWSATTYPMYSYGGWTYNYAWMFSFVDDNQEAYWKGLTFHALAVRDGDVGSVGAVPVPAAAWLLSSGLLGLMGVARRRIQAT